MTFGGTILKYAIGAVVASAIPATALAVLWSQTSPRAQ